MSRRDHPRNRTTSIKIIKPAKSVSRKIVQIEQERGNRNEFNFYLALVFLQNKGVPIMFEWMEKNSYQDRQGIDFMLWGIRPLHLESIGIDIKSSEAGVEEYLQKSNQRLLEDPGFIQRPPRYSYYVSDGEGDASLSFLKALLIFILEKSNSHADKAWKLKVFNPEKEDRNDWDQFQDIINDIFQIKDEE